MICGGPRFNLAGMTGGGVALEDVIKDSRCGAARKILNQVQDDEKEKWPGRRECVCDEDDGMESYK